MTENNEPTATRREVLDTRDDGTLVLGDAERLGESAAANRTERVVHDLSVAVRAAEDIHDADETETVAAVDEEVADALDTLREQVDANVFQGIDAEINDR